MKDFIGLGLNALVDVARHYYHYQQQKNELECEYRLDLAHIKSHTEITCQQISASLQYALAQLEHQKSVFLAQIAVVEKQLAQDDSGYFDVLKQLTYLITTSPEKEVRLGGINMMNTLLLQRQQQLNINQLALTKLFENSDFLLNSSPTLRLNKAS